MGMRSTREGEEKGHVSSEEDELDWLWDGMGWDFTDKVM